SLIRCLCILRRTWGKVTPVVFFEASLLGPQKGISQGDQRDMVVPTQPMATFKMIQAEFLFQFAIVQLDPPAGMSHANQAPQSPEGRTQLPQPILNRLLLCGRPFDQQPLRDALDALTGTPAVCGPNGQPGKARALQTSTALPPAHVPPSRRRQ